MLEAGARSGRQSTEQKALVRAGSIIKQSDTAARSSAQLGVNTTPGRAQKLHWAAATLGGNNIRRHQEETAAQVVIKRVCTSRGRTKAVVSSRIPETTTDQSERAGLEIIPRQQAYVGWKSSTEPKTAEANSKTIYSLSLRQREQCAKANDQHKWPREFGGIQLRLMALREG